jgi:hypothetical protein
VALRLLDIMFIEKMIMDVPFVRERGAANLTQRLAIGQKRKQFR